MPPSVPDASSSLMEQLRAHHSQGLPRLICLYAPVVVRWCRRAGVQQADAENVLQQVILAIDRGIADFQQHSAYSLHSWIYAITRTKLVDHFRTEKKHPPAVGGTDFQDHLQNVPDPNLETDSSLLNDPHSDRYVVIRRAMDLVRGEFESTTWQAFWSVVVDEQSPDEVAETLGITCNAVYLAKSRVKVRLHRELEGLFG